MAFKTYENRTNKHGGIHKHGQGGYREHATLGAAEEYADDTGLPVKSCSYCKPNAASAEGEDSEEDLQFLQRHLVSLIEIKRFADSFDQLCFQMERLWFSLFRRSRSEAFSWFDECAFKTLNIRKFGAAYRDIKESSKAEKINSARIEQILAAADSINDCYNALAGGTKLTDADREGQAYYRHTLDGEKIAIALSGHIYSVVEDMQETHIARETASTPKSGN